MNRKSLLMLPCFGLLLACAKLEYVTEPPVANIGVSIPDTFLTRFYEIPETDTLFRKGYLQSDRRLEVEYWEYDSDMFSINGLSTEHKVKLKRVAMELVRKVFDPTITIDSAVFTDNTLRLNVFDNQYYTAKARQIQWRLKELLP